MKNFLLPLIALFLSFSCLAQVSLPVDFGTIGTEYFTDFGGTTSSVVTDPADPSNAVAKTTRVVSAETWAGTSVGTGFATPIDFEGGTTISMRVYSEYPGTRVHMKVEDFGMPVNFVETWKYTTKENEWETIVFDFTSNVDGSPAFDPNADYFLLSVFFNWGISGLEAGQQDFYWDDVMVGGTSTSLAQLDLPVTFEDPTVSYALTDFEFNSTVLGDDPVNPGETVAITTKTLSASPWAGTVIGTRDGFASTIPFTPDNSRIRMRVYSPAAGIPILLKAEVASDPSLIVQTFEYTTVANEWEVIEWDFTQHDPNLPGINYDLDYDLLAVFFNFGTDGITAGEMVFYWDDVAYGFNTDVEEIAEVPVSVFPNPAKDVITIQTQEEILSVEMYDALGRLVKSLENITSRRVDVSDVASGSYFLKVQTKEGIGSVPVVVE